MTLENLTGFFGWMTVFNIAFLTFAVLISVFLIDWAAGINQRLFRLPEGEARRAYFTWLGNYKLFTIIFSLMPYLALRMI